MVPTYNLNMGPKQVLCIFTRFDPIPDGFSNLHRNGPNKEAVGIVGPILQLLWVPQWL